MFVITADQRGSTTAGDHVDRLLASLKPWLAAWRRDVALPPERTVGDEIQAVITTPDAAVDFALNLMRAGEWSVGIGVGAVDLPLRESARASSGPAFVHARRAVERARGRGEPVPLVVAAQNAGAEEQATAIMQLLAAVVRRRTSAGWEVNDLLIDGATQKDVATHLGISTQAVSQRVASAMLDEERRARPVAAALLERADDSGENA
jgi:hypothetical protein